MIYLYATLIMLAGCALKQINQHGRNLLDIPISPDGVHYQEMAQGKPSSGLYSLRWLLPWIAGLGCRDNLGVITYRWRLITWASLVAMGLALVWYLDGPAADKLFAVGLLVGLVGIVDTHIAMPILVDAAAQVLMIAGAGAWRHGMRPLALCLALVCGMTRETAPVFMSVSAWSLWPLVGLIPVVLKAFRLRRAVVEPAAGEVPFTGQGAEVAKAYTGLFKGKFSLDMLGGLTKHKGVWEHVGAMLLPWGACLLAAFHPSWPLAVAAILGYGQLVLTFDRERIYQWSFPVVLQATVGIVPRQWMIPILIAHLMNPILIKK